MTPERRIERRRWYSLLQEQFYYTAISIPSRARRPKAPNMRLKLMDVAVVDVASLRKASGNRYHSGLGDLRSFVGDHSFGTRQEVAKDSAGRSDVLEGRRSEAYHCWGLKSNMMRMTSFVYTSRSAIMYTSRCSSTRCSARSGSKRYISSISRPRLYIRQILISYSDIRWRWSSASRFRTVWMSTAVVGVPSNNA